MSEEIKHNTKCVECGKTYYSTEGDFHKEDGEEFYIAVCSKDCAKKQGVSLKEIAEEIEFTNETDEVITKDKVLDEIPALPKTVRAAIPIFFLATIISSTILGFGLALMLFKADTLTKFTIYGTLNLVCAACVMCSTFLFWKYLMIQIRQTHSKGIKQEEK